jgi:hypothetical protein
MRIQWLGVVGLGVLGLAAGQGAARAGDADQDVKALAAKIDQRIEAQWAAKGVKPSVASGDAEFLRRVYLDIAGRIPRVAEVRAFLDDPRPDKRQRLVARLLDGPNYANHLTNVFRALMIPPNNNQQFQFFAPTFDSWLRDRLANNVGYDTMVREVLTADPFNPNGNRNAALSGRAPSAEPRLSPIAFYQNNEFKPENLAASTSRLFLGVKLECAQCHDHPFNQYTRMQFWELAAFFTGIQRQPRGGFGAAPPVLRIPGTNKEVRPRFLDGQEPKSQGGKNNRELLADWLTRPDNPYFARAAANRMWAHFFGIGLIEPVDEPGDDNPPSHPELLDELAREFAAHKFDLKFLVRAITASRTYQLSSTCTDATQNEPRLFARMAVKGLTPEQLFDSLVTATGYRDPTRANPRGFVGPNTPRGEFLAKFASQDKRTETHTSILQALALMNGKFIADATSISNSETLAAVLDSPFFDTPEKQIEALYLASLSRKPRPAELAPLVNYVTGGGPKKDPRSALADVFWALLNSSEFILNH